MCKYVEFKNVSKTIKGREVLKDVSITIERGCVTALSGPNGSGKTMIMRCLAGLVYPDRGSIEIEGKVIGQDLSVPPSMGMLLESPAFVERYSGFENLEMLASLRGRLSGEDVRAWMARVGLDPNDKRSYRKYSLGMRQRLGLACACMEEPELLILDEPFNALDSNGVDTVLDLIADARNRDAAVVLACHDSKLLSLSADIVYNIAEGHIDGEAFKVGGYDD